MKFPIKASWLMEEGLWEKVCIVKGWVDRGKGISPDDDVMFTVDQLADFEVFVKTGLRKFVETPSTQT